MFRLRRLVFRLRRLVFRLRRVMFRLRRLVLRRCGLAFGAVERGTYALLEGLWQN
jgi:hypothetical protein